jgi:hypothetical protein
MPVRGGVGVMRGLIESAGGVFDDRYLDDLAVIQEGMGYQVDLHSAKRDMDNFIHRVGGAALHSEMARALDKVTLARQFSVNRRINRVGSVFVRLFDHKTWQADEARRQAFAESGGSAERPAYIEDVWTAKGQRVGRLVTCAELHDDFYFGFVVEGKSGNSYSFDPKSSLPDVLVESSRRLLKPPQFPINRNSKQSRAI